ncbi:DUF7287 family protein [Methanolobus profundi]|uniref:Uncharacterized protein n=1 Tax=Methanolobus profundi TaxID=487685 RepID=A0A1I4SS48_9EURY|nr:hypothetical protein [Methanolobus profundi]SFM67199.1 hypothetical protein SAMN04488696_1982 [Methanolobus profundi]
MADDRGQIAVDFLLGISLFLIALIFTVQFIPGMFMAGSARESSLDYTAYRTATILVEDTGWWGNSTSSGTDWEEHPANAMRVGLAVDDDTSSRLTNTPNVLSMNKTVQLMQMNDEDLIEILGLYNNIDGTRFSYGYNISITKNNGPMVLDGRPVMLGETAPSDRETSKITRIVLVEAGTVANFDADDLPIDPYTASVEDTILNITGPLENTIAIQINGLNITGIDPSFKKLTLDGVNLNEGIDYTSYKVDINGTISTLTSTGKIIDTDIIRFYLEPGLLNHSQTYQLEINLKDITFTKIAPPFVDYRDGIEVYYEPAYLTVEVWQ